MQLKCRYLILPENKNVEASHGQSILDSLLAHKIKIHHSCGGVGTCGTCLVTVKSGGEGLPSRDFLEFEMAVDRGFLPNERLACQTIAQEGLVIFRNSPTKAE